jgi:hypothetical protein
MQSLEPTLHPTRTARQLRTGVGTMSAAEQFNPYGLHAVHIPLRMVPYQGLSWAAKCLYGRLGLYRGKKPDGFCAPDLVELARAMGASIDGVNRWMMELVEQGFIRRVRRGPGRAAECIFLDHTVFHDSGNMPNQTPPIDSAEMPNQGDALIPNFCGSDSAEIRNVDSAEMPNPYKEENIHFENIHENIHSSSGFSYSVAREETAVKHDDEEATFSQNEQTPEPPAGVELPAAGKDENLPEVENGKTPDLVATVPAVTRNPEDLAALVETARGQLRMARAASMDLTCVVTTENLEATSPPDGKITVDILEVFSGYADFELWLKDTVTRGLGRKAKSGGYAFYLADARREVPRVALARRRMDAEAAREREQDAAEAAAVAELDTPMRAIEAFGRIQGRLAGRGVPRPVKARLERTGEQISPNALEAAIRGWKRCAHCGDGGTVGNELDRTLAFCACAAGIEAGYDKGACWPTEETARVHANVKSLLVAACFAVEQPFVADAIGDSEVTDDGETLRIALPAAHFGICEADVRPAAERLGWQRRIVITGGRQFSKPAPAAKPEAAAAPLFKPITQADIDRELELAKRRKPPGMEPIGHWIGGTVPMTG